MELRLLELAIRVLDPRKWRVRLLQLAGSVFGVLWVWYRSVDHAPIDRAVRDARRDVRNERIAARNAELYRARLRP